MIDFDLSKRPSRPSEWVALARAIYAADVVDESGWLECKGPMDWGNSNHLGTVSKAIIAMANRDALDAKTWLEGRAIVSVGVSPGSVLDIEKLDLAVIDDKLRTYLGADGPRWAAFWVDLDGKNVLLIEVDAPRAGDPPYSLQQGTSDLKKSQIFVRVKSKSVSANQAQVNQLAHRFASAESSSLGISLRVQLDYDIAPVISDQASIDTFIESRRAALMLSLATYIPTPEPAEPLGIAASLTGELVNGKLKRENRSAAQYTYEVDIYLKALAKVLPAALIEIGGAVVAAPRFILSNLTDKNYSAVQVDIRVEGLAKVTELRDMDDELKTTLPRKPRTYGDYYERPPGFSMSSLYEQAMSVAPNFGPSNFSRREMRNGGSFELDLDEVDVRPHASEIVLEEEAVVLVPVERTEPVEVSWRATASNVDAIARGTILLPVDGNPVDLTEIFARHY